MADEPIMLDTNVLVHATFSDLPYHERVWTELERGRRGEVQLCVSCHSLAEFFWLITDPEKVATPDTCELGRRKLSELIGARFLRKLPISPSTLLRAGELAERYNLVGPRVLDALLVATMIEGQVTRLFTLHPEDYAPFREIRAENPFA